MLSNIKNYFRNLFVVERIVERDNDINLEEILSIAEDVGALKPDGFDGNKDGYDTAIVGITDDGRLVYSKEKMVDICERDGKMDYSDAVEWLEYNCFCAYVGEQTPLFITTGRYF